MGGFMSQSRLQKFIKITPEFSELTSEIAPFSLINKRTATSQLTPALIIILNNIYLPSYEKFDANEKMEWARIAAQKPFKGLMLSLTSLSKNPHIPLLNRAQIAITTILEFGIRLFGAMFLQPAKTANDWIDKQDINPGIKFASKMFVRVVTSPLWCVAQTVSLAADVLSYSRQAFDAVLWAGNPRLWRDKFREWKTGEINNTPSLKSVGTTFVSATLKLLPAAGIITAGVLTGGTSTVLHSAINTILAKAGSGALATATVLFSGVLAAGSKICSGIVNGATHVLTDPKIQVLDTKKAVLEAKAHEISEMRQSRHSRKNSPQVITTQLQNAQNPNPQEVELVVVTPAEESKTSIANEPNGRLSILLPATPSAFARFSINNNGQKPRTDSISAHDRRRESENNNPNTPRGAFN
jgi:hypothetical protein